MALNYVKLIQNGAEVYSAAEGDFTANGGVRFEKTIDVIADKDSLFCSFSRSSGQGFIARSAGAGGFNYNERDMGRLQLRRRV
jgi:hypothetical protein